ISRIPHDTFLLLLQITCAFWLIFTWIQAACGDVSYSLPEETKRGWVIGNIAKDLGLKSGELSHRKARIEAEETEKRYFDINVENGNLIVADRIDREELCDERASCVVKRELVLESPLELHRVNVHIQDINDNTPQFNDEVIDLEISENAVRGARFLIEEAHDADVGQNSVQQYALNKNDHFVLYKCKTGEIKVIGNVDFEAKTSFEMRVKAKDGLGLSSHGKVIISVTDVNDNAPVVSLKSLSDSVAENTPPGTEVGIINVQDRDSENNRQVRCSLQTGVPFKLVPSIKTIIL
uniref:Cadherin domain-containing protein n=1 Tax=Neogobius melanostomus TaxID=47308 RepID=A0A8C6T570_9GOBI